MVQKSSMRRIIFVLLFFAILVQLIQQSCHAEPVTDIGWKGSALLQAIGTGFQDFKKDKDGVALTTILSKTNKIFGGLSKLGGAAGAIFSLVGGILSATEEDKDEKRHNELLKEFNKVHDGIATINSKITGLKKFIAQ